jgi:hypothetical protein
MIFPKYMFYNSSFMNPLLYAEKRDHEKWLFKESCYCQIYKSTTYSTYYLLPTLPTTISSNHSSLSVLQSKAQVEVCAVNESSIY